VGEESSTRVRYSWSKSCKFYLLISTKGASIKLKDIFMVYDCVQSAMVYYSSRTW